MKTQFISKIIGETIMRLQDAFDYRQENMFRKTPNQEYIHIAGRSRLVFPMYGAHRDFATRVSEQELRFAFVEAFNKICNEKQLNFFYSVETPTNARTYSGFANGNPRGDNPNGRSGEFDMVIYDSHLKRVCLIEFKANNADEKEHKKDFLKLNNMEEGDENVLRYFIEIVRTGNAGTIKSLKNKVKPEKRGITTVVCYELSNGGRNLTDTII